jgi:phosphoglycolate phosphatase
MHLFFDLDGTLTDSAPGIVGCLNHALTELGAPRATETELRACIGSPLQMIFERFLQSTDKALLNRAVTSYKAQFDAVGMFENRLFPGIADGLDEFRQCGHRLQVVTVKPAIVAHRVLEHFAIAHHFDGVHGPAPDEERCNKADFVAAALRHARAPRAEALMIGDRVDDALAARAHGVVAIGVGWGYGSREELLAAGAARIVETVTELRAWIYEVAARGEHRQQFPNRADDPQRSE